LSASPPCSSRSWRASVASALFSPLTWIGASMTFSSTVLCGNRLNRWKTHADLAALAGDLACREAVQHPAAVGVAHEVAVDPDPAAVDGLELVDAAQEGGLARARRPEEDRRPRRGADVHVDALEHLVAVKDLVTLTAWTRGISSRSVDHPSHQWSASIFMSLCFGLLGDGSEATAEVPLEAGLADHEDRADDEVPERRRDEAGHDLEAALSRTT
jgi:hypothetical protein